MQLSVKFIAMTDPNWVHEDWVKMAKTLDINMISCRVKTIVFACIHIPFNGVAPRHQSLEHRANCK